MEITLSIAVNTISFSRSQPRWTIQVCSSPMRPEFAAASLVQWIKISGAMFCISSKPLCSSVSKGPIGYFSWPWALELFTALEHRLEQSWCLTQWQKPKWDNSQWDEWIKSVWKCGFPLLQSFCQKHLICSEYVQSWRIPCSFFRTPILYYPLVRESLEDSLNVRSWLSNTAQV